MKLDEALREAKEAIAEYPGAWELPTGLLEDLVEAIEEHLQAERKSAETLLCLADLQRHGGE